jgi:alpha-beta hydrolase superfamily lysophospholipase
MSSQIDVRIDVTEAVGAGMPLEIAATVVLPDALRIGSRPVVAFGVPGAGYSKGYFLFDMPGSDFGGQAGYHADRQGWIFVASDHLGVGDSSVPDPSVSTLPAVLAAYKATIDHVLQLLAKGTLTPDLPPIADPLCIGMGQSMGGNFTIALQGTSPCFDAVAILGYSAIGTVLPKPDGSGVTFTSAPDDNLHRDRDSVFRYAFHWPDVPEEIASVDTEDYPTRGGHSFPWASTTMPGCVNVMAVRGVVAPQATAIDVPVLMAVGERDIVPDLHAEAAAFPRSRDITLYCQQEMAHMHNFAGTRLEFWERIAAWVAGVDRLR